MKYKFEDETQDRKYFTIVPNYILNHSSATDKALYIDIKRAAGENGRCFMTEETMCNRNGIGKKQLHKSLKYLLDHKWIKFVGMTPAKTRPIKTYIILDIWKKNVDFYQDKKIPSQSRVSKDTVQEEKDSVQESSKILFRRRGIRRTSLRRTIKNNTRKKYSSIKDIQKADLIEIAEKYKVNLGFVELQLEKLRNYCESYNKRYKNYKSALRNFVLGDMQRQVERRQDDSKRGIDARNF